MRLGLEMALREALDRDQFFLHYQPLFDLQSETITGVEALIRWRHPVRGVIPPDSFIPLAEETGLIVPIGRWVLRTACERAVRWHHQQRPIGMSINVSARQLDDDRFIHDLTDTLEFTSLDPGSLTLEITETTLMRDADASAQRLRELKALDADPGVVGFRLVPRPWVPRLAGRVELAGRCSLRSATGLGASHGRTARRVPSARSRPRRRTATAQARARA